MASSRRLPTRDFSRAGCANRTSTRAMRRADAATDDPGRPPVPGFSGVSFRTALATLARCGPARKAAAAIAFQGSSGSGRAATQAEQRLRQGSGSARYRGSSEPAPLGALFEDLTAVHRVERLHHLVVIVVVVDAEKDAVAEPVEPAIDVDGSKVSRLAEAVVGRPVEVG